MQEIVQLLIRLLIYGLIAWFLFWLVDKSGVPTPFSWIVKGIILLLLLIAVMPLLGITL